MSTGVSRRGFLAGVGAVPLIAGAAASSAATGSQRELMEYPIKWLWGHDRTGFVTYPHHNGFFDGGRKMVVRRSPSISEPTNFYTYDLIDDEFQQLPQGPDNRPEIGTYFYVNEEHGLLLATEINDGWRNPERPGIWIFDLIEFGATGTSEWQEVYRIPEEVGRAWFGSWAALHPSATRLVVPINYGAAPDPEIPGDTISTITEVDLATGEAVHRVEIHKRLNHAHYSPYNPDWIIFSREGASTLHNERVWGYHPTLQPDGANIVPQVLADGTPLRLSHERASWDSETVIANNFAAPSGIVRGFFDGSTPEFLAAGPYVHCDVSRDGRYVVAEAGDRPQTRIDLIDLAEGGAITTIVPVTFHGPSHPRHIHPIFSPTGRYVLFQEAEPADVDGGGLRVGIVDLRPDGEQIVFRSADSGVPNRAGPDGRTFLDLVWSRSPFREPASFVRHVRALTLEWQAHGLLNVRESQQILAAALRSGIGRTGLSNPADQDA